MAKKKHDEFELLNQLPEAVRDPEISKDDFKLVKTDENIHDTKFQTKPTTFFKDCVRRFRKNKSSVVAAYILGFLLLLAVVVPVASPYNVGEEADNSSFEYLEPRLFNAGFGFWDGTKKIKEETVDLRSPEAQNATTEEEKQQYWWPDREVYVENAISKKVFTDKHYLSSVSNFAEGGFFEFTQGRSIGDEIDYSMLYTTIITDEVDFSKVNVDVKTFDTYDLEKINELPGEVAQKYSEYQITDTSLDLVVKSIDSDGKVQYTAYEIVAPSKTHNIGSAVLSLKEPSVSVNTALAEQTSETKFSNFFFAVRIKNNHEHINRSCLIKSLEFTVSGNDAGDIMKKALTTYTEPTGEIHYGASFTDAAQTARNRSKLKDTDPGFWHTMNSDTGLFMSKGVTVSFVYDTYEAKLGTKYRDVTESDLRTWRKNKWLRITLPIPIIEVGDQYVLDVDNFECKILDEEHCPLTKNLTPEDIYVDPEGPSISNPQGYTINGFVAMYKYKGFTSMPRFLFGTDAHGRDMMTYVFSGLRYSLLLGIISSAVCFIFGLIWGAICGYFGGNVDLIMERFTDILSGIPWIVVMTLVIMKMGQNFVSFAIALCLTGWIGTAATTRTQFYRFRGREYVLASRTLGASDARLISRHILPNAMGTIITSAVLMIPGVIFSEATISFLGLGLKGTSSLGVILSDNQLELELHSHLLIFPSIVIALLMISFNLFGNGLRDAVNPSLKGEGE